MFDNMSEASQKKFKKMQMEAKEEQFKVDKMNILKLRTFLGKNFDKLKEDFAISFKLVDDKELVDEDITHEELIVVKYTRQDLSQLIAFKDGMFVKLVIKGNERSWKFIQKEISITDLVRDSKFIISKMELKCERKHVKFKL